MSNKIEKEKTPWGIIIVGVAIFVGIVILLIWLGQQPTVNDRHDAAVKQAKAAEEKQKQILAQKHEQETQALSSQPTNLGNLKVLAERQEKEKQQLAAEQQARAAEQHQQIAKQKFLEQQDIERQRAFAQLQEQIKQQRLAEEKEQVKQRFLVAQEIERRQALAQQQEIEKQQALAQQQEIERQRAAILQQQEIERQRAIAQQQEIEKQKIVAQQVVVFPVSTSVKNVGDAVDAQSKAETKLIDAQNVANNLATNAKTPAEIELAKKAIGDVADAKVAVADARSTVAVSVANLNATKMVIDNLHTNVAALDAKIVEQTKRIALLSDQINNPRKYKGITVFSAPKLRGVRAEVQVSLNNDKAMRDQLLKKIGSMS